jgi:hypothetical protein
MIEYFIALVLIINAFMMVTNLYVMWLYKKKENIAFIIKKDNTAKYVKINTSKEYFKYDNGLYIIPRDTEKYNLLYGRKKIYRYVEGTPEPYMWYVDDKPLINAEVFHSIIENSGLKLLNTISMSKSMLMYIVIAVVAVVVIMILFG